MRVHVRAHVGAYIRVQEKVYLRVNVRGHAGENVRVNGTSGCEGMGVVVRRRGGGGGTSGEERGERQGEGRR